MSESATSDAPRRADYGIDAPPVVRNLALAGLGCLLIAFLFEKMRWAVFPGAIFLVEVGLMIYSSRVGKLRQRDLLLDAIPWRGDESVLDVGCGRGLMLLGAAKRLTTGRAHGVDIWQKVDQSGNSREVTERNALAEGVTDRVEIHDGDARKLPFGDASFDVILSSLALHNIYDAAGRAAAVKEIVRVLRPLGRVALVDIRHTAQYARAFEESGLRDVTRSGMTWRIFPPVRVVTARKPSA